MMLKEVNLLPFARLAVPAYDEDHGLSENTIYFAL